jgi:hypothetical protein
MNDELKAAAERLQAFIRKHDPGQCRMLSEGHSCQCLLCDVSRLGGAAMARLVADKAERAEREKPIDDEWLRSTGWKQWDDRDDIYSGELYCTFGEWLGWETRLTFHLGCIESVRMTNDDELSGVSAEAVILLGEPCSKSKPVTRGQLLDLLRALGKGA